MNTLDKQTAKLIGRIAENLPEIDGDIMQRWIDNPKGLQKFLRGLCPSEVVASKGEIPLDIIHVDRSVRPSYPDWVEMIMHPELENVGPTDYSIVKVDQWLHDDQKGGKCTKGNNIYTHLKETGDLKNHLGLRDLEEIQKKGITFFRKYFKGKAVFAWQGVVRRRHGHLGVPCLFEYGDEVVLGWDWLGDGWVGGSPGLRHAS